MSKKEQLNDLIPFRQFTENARRMTEDHLKADLLFCKGYPRYVSSVLAALYEECQDRPDLKELILEAAWMSWRMSVALARHKGADLPKVSDMCGD
jgi:hypothetical protein